MLFFFCPLEDLGGTEVTLNFPSAWSKAFDFPVIRVRKSEKPFALAHIDIIIIMLHVRLHKLLWPCSVRILVTPCIAWHNTSFDPVTNLWANWKSCWNDAHMFGALGSKANLPKCNRMTSMNPVHDRNNLSYWHEPTWKQSMSVSLGIQQHITSHTDWTKRKQLAPPPLVS